MNNSSKFSHKVRHFSYMQECAKANDPKKFEELFKAKCLRTILWQQGSSQLKLLKIEHLDTSFPSLRVLSINDCYTTKLPNSIGNLKYLRSLDTLKFEYLSKLEEWSFIEGGVFPRLKNLQFKWCERLKVSLLADHFPSLTELEIVDCEELIPLLLPRAQLMEAPLISLKRIMISECFNLTRFDDTAFQHLTSLEELKIRHCSNLQCLPKELPTSLSDLYITGCKLLRPRVERETGKDWPIIAHIPNIIVDDKKT
ncbi:hypothetical protein CsatA_002796 [Cannabis sativa]